MGAELQVELKFSDAEIENEFYQVMMKQNEQQFVSFIGGTVEAIQAATDEDRRAFVRGIVSKQVVDNFLSLTIQQATQEMQTALIETHKDRLKAKEEPSPFVLARADKQNTLIAATKKKK